MNNIKNPHEKCYLRDKAILSEIEKLKILNTDQIQTLFCSNDESGARIARNICHRLREKKKLIYSNRFNINESAYHFIDKKLKNHPQIEHMLITNWVYIWFKSRLNKTETISYFEHEIFYLTLRADGFLGINNPNIRKKIFYFIESDISHNNFDKVIKYNTLFKNKEEWINDWWIKEADGFPAIFIATNRKDYVLNKIAMENKYNLVFRVYDIKQIKGK